jgi:hypothetical protein
MSKKSSKAIKMVDGSQEFRDACSKAGVKTTKRQWRKWERGFGSAFTAHKGQ